MLRVCKSEYLYPFIWNKYDKQLDQVCKSIQCFSVMLKVFLYILYRERNSMLTTAWWKRYFFHDFQMFLIVLDHTNMQACICWSKYTTLAIHLHLFHTLYKLKLYIQNPQPKNLQRYLNMVSWHNKFKWPGLSPYSRRQILFIQNSTWSTNVGIRWSKKN